ncbi:hypothetical protein DHEL01_v208747 [Diaporthe helianthi]|uniref:Uncharacterized protein n=1 Tax=Diaporthe helianthi TaxID=158607 RepID=A0A2P5HRG1_DIAHE|nr:hypothetical protein DHEL01_v208747 [Diaporthe helianthi]
MVENLGLAGMHENPNYPHPPPGRAGARRDDAFTAGFWGKRGPRREMPQTHPAVKIGAGSRPHHRRGAEPDSPSHHSLPVQSTTYIVRLDRDPSPGRQVL